MNRRSGRRSGVFPCFHHAGRFWGPWLLSMSRLDPENLTRARTMYIGDVRNAITSRLKRATGRGSWNMVGVGVIGRGDLLPLFCFGAGMDLSHTTKVWLCPFLAFGCKVKLRVFF